MVRRFGNASGLTPDPGTNTPSSHSPRTDSNFMPPWRGGPHRITVGVIPPFSMSGATLNAKKTGRQRLLDEGMLDWAQPDTVGCM
jgi:hypothetical protein